MRGYGFDTSASEVARGIDLTGKQVVLTGASSGIGGETARVLGSTGARLVLGARDLEKGRAALEGVEGRLLPLDLSDLHSVIDFAAQVEGPVDVLICNAGVSVSPDTHLPNGLEVRFATNHLGHFLLAHLLKEQMAQRGARIVVVSSAAHKGMPVQLDDLQWTRRQHSKGGAYCESKSANILFAQEATRRWGREGIYANALMPGAALTGLQRHHDDGLMRAFGFIDTDGRVNPMVKTPAQAAATSVWAATAPELAGRGGLMLEDCAEALIVGPETHAWTGFDPTVTDPETARLLWEHSLELVRQLAGENVLSAG